MNIKDNAHTFTEIDAVMWEIRSALFAAMAKHAPMHSYHEGYAVILEELDELKDEVWAKYHDKDALKKEAAHVGAMAA